MSQNYRKTLLIVCEGTRSEPDYFNNIRNEVIENCGGDIYIKILPIPSQEKIQEDVENFKVRKGAKKRQIKEPEVEVEDYIVENEYKAQPTCYVRKAQLAYLESNYDELWAVYDKDGHPNHEEALELSKSNEQFEKKVNIGFSSISFEMWLLLHFEYSNNAFQKSQCRNQLKEVFNCGTNSHPEDCKGIDCVVGRIVESGHLQYHDSKFFDYHKYSSHYSTAAENAISLRETTSSVIPFYELNPYISIDKLVFKLKYFHKIDHIWNNENVFKFENDMDCSIGVVNNMCEVEFTNNSNTTYILQESWSYLTNANYDILSYNPRKVLTPGNNFIFAFNLQTEFSYLVVKNKFDEAYIFDRDFIKKLA